MHFNDINSLRLHCLEEAEQKFAQLVEGLKCQIDVDSNTIIKWYIEDSINYTEAQVIIVYHDKGKILEEVSEFHLDDRDPRLVCTIASHLKHRLSQWEIGKATWPTAEEMRQKWWDKL